MHEKYLEQYEINLYKTKEWFVENLPDYCYYFMFVYGKEIYIMYQRFTRCK